MRLWILLAALVLARIGFGFQLQTVASLGPELSARFGLDYAALGGLIGVYLLPGVFVALPGGLLASRIGERGVLLAGFALMAAGGVVAALAAGPGWIGAGRLVSGIGAVALVVLQAKVLADRFSGRGFMLAIGLVVGSFPIGIGLAQLGAAPIARAFGWPASFLAGSAVVALAALLFLIGFRPVHRGLSGGRPGLPGRREVLLVVLAGVIWTSFNAGYLTFLDYIPSLMAGRGDSPAMLALVMTIASWGNVPAMLLGGDAATRLGERPVFLFGTLVCAAGIVGMALPGLGPALAPVWAVLFGVLGSVHASVIIARGARSTRPEHIAVGQGVFYTLYYAGGAGLPAFCGFVGDRTGNPAAVLYTAAALSLLALPAWALHARMAGR